VTAATCKCSDGWTNDNWTDKKDRIKILERLGGMKKKHKPHWFYRVGSADI